MNKVKLRAARFRRKRIAEFGQFGISADKTPLRLGAQAIPDIDARSRGSNLVGHQNVTAPWQCPQRGSAPVAHGSSDIPDGWTSESSVTTQSAQTSSSSSFF